MFRKNEIPEYYQSRIDSFGLDPEEITANSNYFLGQVNSEVEVNYHVIGWNDAMNAALIEQKGLEKRLEKQNGIYDSDTEGVIRFPNEAIAVVWMDEILGQISDGMWENSALNWMAYTQLAVEVDEYLEYPEIDSDVEIPDFTSLLNNKALIARMLFLVRASRIEEDYSEVGLAADLGKLENANRIKRVNDD